MARRFDKQPTGPPSSSASLKKAVVSGDRGYAGIPSSVTSVPQSPSKSQLHPPPRPTAVASTTPTSPTLPSTSQASGSMDKIREKLAALKAEADQASDRADAAEGKVKKLEQELLVKEQEIGSLTHKNGLLQDEVDKVEIKLKELKARADEGESGKSTNDALSRKIQILEDELDASEKNVKETVEKLRQVDVKAEHFERQVQRLEQERDQWEKKYEDALAKYDKAKKELDELVMSMEGI